MSEADYTRQCNHCQKTITMSKRSGKWAPYDGNEFHSCQTITGTKEEKNNHGAEEFVAKEISRPVITAPVAQFKDHTRPPNLKIKTLTDPTPDGYDQKYNTFTETHRVHYSQSHIAGSLYVMVVWYEEESK
jgi:hypothetical protein